MEEPPEWKETLEEARQRYGISKKRVHAYGFSDKILMCLILPEDIISGWKVTPKGGIRYPRFLVRAVELIAEPYNWSVLVQHASPEDDPLRVDAWCEAQKGLPKPVAREKLTKAVKEASHILEKAKKAIAKHSKKKEEIEKTVKAQFEKDIQRFVADI